MNDTPRVIHRPSDNSPEEARNARAAAWAFVFNRYQTRKKGGPATAPDDGTKFKEDSTNALIIPKK